MSVLGFFTYVRNGQRILNKQSLNLSSNLRLRHQLQNPIKDNVVQKFQYL